MVLSLTVVLTLFAVRFLYHRINEPEGLNTFRIGLFGIDKLTNVDKTVKALEDGIDYVMSDEAGKGKRVA